MSGPLANLRIVEMAGIGPCPLAGQFLADLGADVIVIDRASGPVDPTDIHRRGKRSIALDLKKPQGLEVAKALVSATDILIEGYRPGVMERLGLGPNDLPTTLIYGRMTGWGQDGPLSHTAGHDINYLSLTGALAAIGEEGKPPPPPLNFVADYGGGTMFLLFGILAALYEREQSGKGQVVDAAMIDGVSAMMALFHSMRARGAWNEDTRQNWLDGGAPFYRTYKTADGKFISAGALEPQFHAILLEKAELPSEHQSSQMTASMWAERHRQYEDVFARKTQAEWVDIFEGTDACVAPILKMSEAPKHSHMRTREVFQEIDGVMQASPAPRFSRSEVAALTKPNGPGHDSEAILEEAGYSAEQISRLRASNTLV